MKYFTAQLWSDYNSPVRSVREKAEKQWNRNRRSYWKYIAKILPHLSPSARSFFRETSLHDGIIFSVSFGDSLTFSKTGIWPKTSFAEIKVLHPETDDLYILHYSWLREFTVEYNAEKHYREKIYYVFGDWGYNELFLTKDKWLKHEILFDSGATVKLEFKHFSYEVKRIKNKKGEVRLCELELRR